MTRTVWPRASNRRTTASIGGVLPPPSQCANKNDRAGLIRVTFPPLSPLRDGYASTPLASRLKVSSVWRRLHFRSRRSSFQR